MASVPLVTVILTSYNHARFVEESLESVLNQSLGDLEVMAIDDCSTDDSYDRLRRIQDRRVTVFRNDCNRGRHSRNWALCNARGTFIAFQNSDDVWLPGKLTVQLQFLSQNPECGVCFTGVEMCDEAGRPLPDHPHWGRVFRVEEHNRLGWLRRFFLQGNCLAFPSAVMRREVLESIGPFDPGFFQLPDFDLWVRAAGVTELNVLPRPLTRFRVHTDGSNVSAPSAAVENRWPGEWLEILDHYSRPPILNDLARIFEFGPDEEDNPDAPGGVWDLARLGFLATSLDGVHQRRSGVHFLREALRRGDRAGALNQRQRSRIAHRLHRISGEIQS
jgi:glycosyltransferase involved in cell wall biosynthesis